MLTNHTLTYPCSIPNVCINVIQDDGRFIRFKPSHGIPNFSTNSGYSALEFWEYTCIKHREWSNNFNLNTYTLFLLVGSIHQHNLPAEAYKYPHPSLGKLCWLNAGVEEFPPIVQLNSVRATTLSRRDANNIQGISFSLLNQSMLFHCD